MQCNLQEGEEGGRQSSEDATFQRGHNKQPNQNDLSKKAASDASGEKGRGESRRRTHPPLTRALALALALNVYVELPQAGTWVTYSRGNAH